MTTAVASLGSAVRLATREERAHWRSKTLLMLAAILAWTFPAAALAGVATAWTHYYAGEHDAIPIILAPIGWLILMGLVFALVDFVEDGVIGNARRLD
ncbi:MAG: hypothetical protein ABW199_03310 [Caulobacterales bacterium]